MKTMNMISRRSFLKAAMAALSDRLRFVRFEHCIRHRFRCSSIFCHRQRGRPDLQGGHCQLR